MIVSVVIRPYHRGRWTRCTILRVVRNAVMSPLRLYLGKSISVYAELSSRNISKMDEPRKESSTTTSVHAQQLFITPKDWLDLCNLVQLQGSTKRIITWRLRGMHRTTHRFNKPSTDFRTTGKVTARCFRDEQNANTVFNAWEWPMVTIRHCLCSRMFLLLP